LTPLVGLTQLQRLYLDQTGVTDLTPLAGLTQLQWLYLDQTRVTDLTPLRALSTTGIFIGVDRDVRIPPELKGHVHLVRA
jgi:Leucine-rich repeat (LRR) protein